MGKHFLYLVLSVAVLLYSRWLYGRTLPGTRNHLNSQIGMALAGFASLAMLIELIGAVGS
jgi:hypothetical protein